MTGTEPKTIEHNAVKTRATPAPPKKDKTFLAAVSTEKPVEAADNMAAEKLVGMTFNMPKSWHTRFKLTAVSRGLDMKEFLVECFDVWEREERLKMNSRRIDE